MIYLIIFLFPIIAFTQVDIFGYYEAEYDHIQLADKSYNFGYNKLRLDLESRPGENVKIGANINFLLFNGKTEFNIFDFLPMDSGDINGETISSLSEPLMITFCIFFVTLFYVYNNLSRASLTLTPSINLPAPGRHHTLYVHFRVCRVLCF